MTAHAYQYGLEDRPPTPTLWALGAQHAVLALVFLVYPLAVAQELAMDPGSTLAFLSSCVIGIGVATCLHSFRAPVGSASLAVEIPTPLFLPTAMIAGGMGGMSAIAAVSLLCGLTEVFFARVLRHVRALFPAEICGIAVLMLGVSIIRPGMLNAFGLTQPTGIVQGASLLVSVATLTTITVLSVFGSPRIKILALAGGILVGVSLAVKCGLLGSAEWNKIAGARWLALPGVSLELPQLDISLVPLAIVMALAQSVDNLGMLVGIQQQVEPRWHKLDLRQASGGIQVSGIGDLVSGIFGGMPTGISSANVGLAHATGAVARRIALVAGVLLLAAPFVPKIIVAVSLVPRPVVGAIVVYAAVYMVVSGMSLILDRVLNDRRIFVIGFSVVLGLTSALIPGIYHSAPSILQPILESPLAVSALAAILLTQLFRLGAALRRNFELLLSDTDNESLQELQINRTLRHELAKVAADIGASKAFLDRVIDVTAELLAAMRVLGCVKGNVRFTARMEDARMEITLVYDGLPVPTGQPDGALPSDELASSSPLANLLRVSRHVDRLEPRSSGSHQNLLLVYQP